MDVCFIVGAALVQINPPRYSKTYGEYCEKELTGKIKTNAADGEHADPVFDMYKKSPREQETRELSRNGDDVRILVKASTQVYPKFNQILAVDSNKTELFNSSCRSIG